MDLNHKHLCGVTEGRAYVHVYMLGGCCARMYTQVFSVPSCRYESKLTASYRGAPGRVLLMAPIYKGSGAYRMNMFCGFSVSVCGALVWPLQGTLLRQGEMESSETIYNS